MPGARSAAGGRAEEPPLKEVLPGHLVACHLREDGDTGALTPTVA